MLRQDRGVAEGDIGVKRRADAFDALLQQGGRKFASGEYELHEWCDSVKGLHPTRIDRTLGECRLY